MNHVIIIAEAGVNHNGSIETAKKMIDAASDAGVDYVKFQTFKADKLVSTSAKKADYQKKNITQNEDDSQLSMLQKLELSINDHYELIEYCKKRNVKFFSTAFDIESIDFLHKLQLGLWKIPSGEITNYPYLKKIGQYKQELILSTGMCEMLDIKKAIEVLCMYGLTKDKITILHCNTEYPTPFEDVNLYAMKTISEEFGVKVGYSDHTEGIEVPVAAVALGACIIEKHFTLDRNMEGPDHKASLEPGELYEMVKAIRNIEKAVGSKEKKISISEQKNLEVARKSIVAAIEIAEGDLFTEENLTVKRPGSGISPMLWESILGRKAIKNFKKDDLIEI